MALGLPHKNGDIDLQQWGYPLDWLNGGYQPASKWGYELGMARRIIWGSMGMKPMVIRGT
jgi:hypothetical protein